MEKITQLDDPSTLAALADLGAMVRVARTQRRWTQTECAKIVNVENSTLSRLENGRGGVSAVALLRIAGHLELDLNSIAVAIAKPRRGRPRRAS